MAHFPQLDETAKAATCSTSRKRADTLATERFLECQAVYAFTKAFPIMPYGTITSPNVSK